MSDYAIKVEGLGKKYLLRHQAAGKRYVALRDVLTEKAKAFFGNRKSESGNRQSTEEFWALKDVSFEVKPGEAVGIIGRNGAGKSTLLKLLSRITEPTSGRIRLRGRVASLLEVGTGFHPELTGRENIFLNGAILGMNRVEIRDKFDEIVDFAEVEKFLDTPVKHYSSGMYMRLAFAVAAHLEPEILIVDEVLAVGDMEFQKKCLGKMEDASKGGRTVLFVSHNMDAVLRLCRHGMVLQQGTVSFVGDAKTAIGRYLGNATKQPHEVDLSTHPRTGELRKKIQFLKVRLRNHIDGDAWRLPFGWPLCMEIDFRATTALPFAEIGANIFSTTGQEIISSLSSNSIEDNAFQPGDHRCLVDFGRIFLVPGRYQMSLGLRSDSGMEDHLLGAVEFEVSSSELSAKFRADTFEGLLCPPVLFKRINITP